ncbi:hypothetical protein LG047_04305 [Methylocystis sp. WRRC1]|uniref:hypothetical protein n=1 Tax=unclassified Methylocystis TaxID=2625913 RepID=UPI0001F86CF1|nr:MULTISPECIES: hypothetical protein [unclassified Methylocystis]MCC3244551.1 hypothetical protein [Methylocystis sp. WRRC1]
MPIFKLPLSGDVTQTINPWTAFFSPFGNQYGLINISLGRSSAPEVEEEVLENVGSYGKQLGRMGDALGVLLDHFRPERPLTRAEKKAIRALRDMLEEIDDIKRARGRSPAPDNSTE